MDWLSGISAACYITHDARGRIVGAGTAPFETVADLPVADGITAQELSKPLDAPETWRWGVDGLEPLPPAPGPHHRFDYDTGAWTLDAERAWAAVRTERDERLAATDWRVLRAQERGQALPPEWLAYRQALRDITEQPDPLHIVWPDMPA